MIVYYSKTYRHAMSRAVLKDVSCERCKCAYRYELIRRVERTSSGLFSSASSAEKNASKALEKALRKGVDPVPCPDCGWFQQPMVHEYRRRRLKWLKVIGWIGTGIGLVMLLCAVYLHSKGFEVALGSADWSALWQIALTTTAFALVFFGGRFMLVRARDLNAGFPDRPALILGAPRGFKPGAPAEPRAVEPIYASSSTLSYQRSVPGVSPDGWSTVQLLRMRLPAVCASCLQTTQTSIKYRLSRHLADVPVPMCLACHKVAKKARIKWALIGGLGAAAVVTLPLLAITETGPGAVGGPIVFGVIAFLVAGWISYTIVDRRYRPVRFRRFAPSQNTIDIRFKNPAFAAAFADVNGLA